MSGESSPCFVCAYATSPCVRSELNGTLQALDPDLLGATLRLSLDGGDVAELTLRTPWGGLVADIERHGLAAAPTERPVSLAAYHLLPDPGVPGRWQAGPESLVVLEPEWLEDVTSLTRTQYCEREYLIGKFLSEASGEAILRGLLAHDIFRQIVATPNDNSLLQRSLEQALRGAALQLALLGLDPETAREESLPVLRNLVRWARRRGPAGTPRTETFLLAHRLGMRGRIDAAWDQDGRIETVAELKTGKTWRGRARPEHELQVGAYGLMLAERGQANLREERLLLLYGANQDDLGQPDLERQVPFRASTFANLVHFRNRLVLIDLTGRATYQSSNRCGPCRLKLDCHRLTELLEAPRCAGGCVLGERCPGQPHFSPTERAFFAYWAGLLDREWRALNDATARLWRTPPEQRCADGSAAGVVGLEPLAARADGSQAYKLSLSNDCEIRPGDRLLLSDENGPAAGQVAQVEVLAVTERELEVLASEPPRFAPRWIDQYGSDRLFLRNYAGLYSWLAEPAQRRELLAVRRPPRFRVTGPSPRVDLSDGRELNSRQREALALALRAEEYLLIQGPPGTGKTELIAALARQLVDDRQRVLLLAGTNRALDRLIGACARLGQSERLIRLGGGAEAGSPAEQRLLSRLAAAERPAGSRPEAAATTTPSAELVARFNELLESPIIAATVATVGGGTYSSLRGRFDTVILDEASQVTLPAALGVVGFGQRFVLVGDHRQLPPVILSQPLGDAPGLGESLFEHLARAREQDGQPGLIRLEEQYRMNAEICAFPSATWYGGDLRPARAVAGGRLELVSRSSAIGHEADDGSGAPRYDLPAQPLVLVNVPDGTGGAPRTNRREAEAASGLVAAAVRSGLPPDDIAIIAPFRAQVAAIRLELARSGDPLLAATVNELVDTVDRFQGSERRLVIYSFCSFGSALHPLMLDERRLNVALTRARHQLILLGDLRQLRTHPRFAELETFCRGLYPDGGGVVDLCALRSDRGDWGDQAGTA